MIEKIRSEVRKNVLSRIATVVLLAFIGWLWAQRDGAVRIVVEGVVRETSAAIADSIVDSSISAGVKPSLDTLKVMMQNWIQVQAQANPELYDVAQERADRKNRARVQNERLMDNLKRK